MQEESGLPRYGRRALRSASAAFLVSSGVLAQAWLAPEGEASFGVGYQSTYTHDHLFSEGEERDRGRIRMSLLVFGLTYSFSDRLAAGASVPYVSARYEGSLPNIAPGLEWVDDGSYHGTFTDLRLDLRYNLLDEPAMVTPFVSAVIPTRDYASFGQAAPASGLEQYMAGVSVGRRLDPFLEAGYAQARYTYAFVEEVIGVAHDRSNADLEIGYFLTPSLGIAATGSWQKTHGGIDIPVPDTPAHDAFRRTPYFRYRHQLARTSFVNVGVAVGYALTATMDVFASYQSTVWGRNMHAIQPALSFGVNWGFSPKRVIRSLATKRATSDAAAE